MNQTAKSQWKTIDRFVEINSHWVKLIAEHLETTEGQIVEYWRVERADSVVILTIQAEKFLFPPTMYRPGVASATLDFPGGRVPAQVTPAAAVPAIMNPQRYNFDERSWCCLSLLKWLLGDTGRLRPRLPMHGPETWPQVRFLSLSFHIIARSAASPARWIG
jgi:hypothetical protein